MLRPRILIVDDDPSTSFALEGVLQCAGFQTASAGTVAKALSAIRAQHPDLILLDINLGDGSGFDVCRLLQTNLLGVTTPILFISADGDPATKVQAFESGGVDYITKPLAGGEVIARVRTHLRLKQAYERLSELQVERSQALASAQRTIMPLPDNIPQANFEASIRQVLAAGGDFYDVIPVGPSVVDYLVADCSGHDLAASFWTAALKALATEYARPLNLPLEIVSAINSALCRLLPSGSFFTLAYARLDHRSGRLSLVNAGHPPAILIPAGNSEPTIVNQEGDVAGAFRAAVFGSTELTMFPGDRLILYTDGIVENGSTPRETGIRQLAECCFSKRTLPLGKFVPAVVSELTAERTCADDMLLMAVQE